MKKRFSIVVALIVILTMTISLPMASFGAESEDVVQEYSEQTAMDTQDAEADVQQPAVEPEPAEEADVPEAEEPAEPVQIDYSVTSRQEGTKVIFDYSGTAGAGVLETGAVSVQDSNYSDMAFTISGQQIIVDASALTVDQLIYLTIDGDQHFEADFTAAEAEIAEPAEKESAAEEDADKDAETVVEEETAAETPAIEEPAVEEEVSVDVDEATAADTEESTLGNLVGKVMSFFGLKRNNEAYDYTYSKYTDSSYTNVLGDTQDDTFTCLIGVADSEGTNFWCYCVDLDTSVQSDVAYSRTTVSAADYFGEDVSAKVRAIVLNSYPNVSVEYLQKKYNLPTLTATEAVAATQWAVWYHTNALTEDGLAVESPYTYTGNSANVTALAQYLCGLEPAGPYKSEPVDLVINASQQQDQIIFEYAKDSTNLKALEDKKITVTDADGNEIPFTDDGTKVIVQAEELSGGIDAAAQIKVRIDGVQTLEKDVYVYSPEGGRKASQTLVSAFEGVSAVAAEKTIAYTTEYLYEGDLKVTKEVLVDGNLYGNNKIYYVTLFEDEALTQPVADSTKPFIMAGDSTASVTYDGLTIGQTYYIAETDAEGNVLKSGDVGTAEITIDVASFTIDMNANEAEVQSAVITNSYSDEEYFYEESDETETDEEETINQSGNSSESKSEESTQTGDDSDMTVYVVLMLAGMLTMAGIGIRSRKRMDH